MYVAQFTLLWGTMTFVGMSLALHYLNGVPFSARGFLAVVLIWYPFGFLLGFYIWYVNESKYRESINAR